MTKIRFGTDGIRGLAGRTPCTPEVGMALGRAVVRWLRPRVGSIPVVLIGRDTRESGPVLEAAVAAGVAGEGGTARLAGVVPTPAMAVALQNQLGDAGIQLTASHNPAEDNGFKILGPLGKKLLDDDQIHIEQELMTPSDGGSLGDIEHIDIISPYLSAISHYLGDLGSLASVPMVIDLANGASAALSHRFALTLPMTQWMGLSGRINDNVGSEHPEALIAKIREVGAPYGFAVDGDGDRCRLATAAGPVDGDALAVLLVRALGIRRLAVTVMSNSALEEALSGVTIVRTPVGDRHLAEVLSRGEAELGVEESGHVLLPGFPSGDGLLTGLMALRYVAMGPGTIAAGIQGFQPFPRRVTKVRINARPELEAVPALEQVRQAAIQDLGGRGRIFLRYSGTEPVLRILVEGPDAALVDALSGELTRTAMEALG